jgi:hypothetical protein
MSDNFVTLTPEEKRKRRARSLALILALFGFVALFYAITLFKFHPLVK